MPPRVGHIDTDTDQQERVSDNDHASSLRQRTHGEKQHHTAVATPTAAASPRASPRATAVQSDSSENEVLYADAFLSHELDIAPALPPLLQSTSLFTAFICWLLAGLWGAHLIYLKRGKQACLYMFTFGLFGVGPFLDFLQLHHYVAQANHDASFLQFIRSRLKPVLPRSTISSPSSSFSYFISPPLRVWHLCLTIPLAYWVGGLFSTLPYLWAAEGLIPSVSLSEHSLLPYIQDYVHTHHTPLSDASLVQALWSLVLSAWYVGAALYSLVTQYHLYFAMIICRYVGVVLAVYLHLASSEIVSFALSSHGQGHGQEGGGWSKLRARAKAWLPLLNACALSILLHLLTLFFSTPTTAPPTNKSLFAYQNSENETVLYSVVLVYLYLHWHSHYQFDKHTRHYLLSAPTQSQARDALALAGVTSSEADDGGATATVRLRPKPARCWRVVRLFRYLLLALFICALYLNWLLHNVEMESANKPKGAQAQASSAHSQPEQVMLRTYLLLFWRLDGARYFQQALAALRQHGVTGIAHEFVMFTADTISQLLYSFAQESPSSSSSSSSYRSSWYSSLREGYAGARETEAYQLLGLQPPSSSSSSSKAEAKGAPGYSLSVLKKARNKQALLLHPDKITQQVTDKFRAGLLSEAEKEAELKHRLAEADAQFTKMQQAYEFLQEKYQTHKR